MHSDAFGAIERIFRGAIWSLAAAMSARSAARQRVSIGEN
jgi:hypothetical protein